MRRVIRKLWFKARFKLFAHPEDEWWYKVNQNRKNVDFADLRSSDLRPSKGKFAQNTTDSILDDEVSKVDPEPEPLSLPEDSEADFEEQLDRIVLENQDSDDEFNAALDELIDRMHNLGY